jgi:hypothetical protein
LNSLRLVGVLALLLVLGALVPATGGSASGRPADTNPLAGLQFYVDHGSPSWLEWGHLTRSGQRQKADLIWKIAREPKAVWVGRFTSPNFRVKVRRIFDGAHEQGAVPILTVLRPSPPDATRTTTEAGPRRTLARAPGTTTSPARSATIGS